MTSLREFSRWAGKDGLLPGFKLPTQGQALSHPLPGLAADIELLLEKCKSDEQRALIALLGYEGLRLHEALDLGPKDFDVRQMAITIWGKGNKIRLIPLTEKAWPHLAPALINSQLSGRSRIVAYSDRGARHFITELGVKAGIKRPISSHDLRHTFATCAYNEVKDPRVIQGWLGHADLATTQGYLAGDMNAMRAAGEF